MRKLNSSSDVTISYFLTTALQLEGSGVERVHKIPVQLGKWKSVLWSLVTLFLPVLSTDILGL